LLKNPALLFYFKVIEIVTGSLRNDFKKNYPDLFPLPFKEFFQWWELIYISGRAFNNKELRKDLASLDQQIQRYYSVFEFSPSSG